MSPSPTDYQLIAALTKLGQLPSSPQNYAGAYREGGQHFHWQLNMLKENQLEQT